MISFTRHHLVTLFITVLMLFSPSIAQSTDRVPSPEIKIPEGAQACIRPAEFMRKNHMNLLTHKRDETVHNGIRTPDASLEGCINCHANKTAGGEAIPVNAPGQFCSSCHEFAAVKLDCFECHRTTPEEIVKTGSLPPAPFGHIASPVQSTILSDLRDYLDEVRQ